jgi:hypothetical protein
MFPYFVLLVMKHVTAAYIFHEHHDFFPASQHSAAHADCTEVFRDLQGLFPTQYDLLPAAESPRASAGAKNTHVCGDVRAQAVIRSIHRHESMNHTSSIFDFSPNSSALRGLNA